MEGRKPLAFSLAENHGRLLRFDAGGRDFAATAKQIAGAVVRGKSERMGLYGPGEGD